MFSQITHLYFPTAAWGRGAAGKKAVPSAFHIRFELMAMTGDLRESNVTCTPHVTATQARGYESKSDVPSLKSPPAPSHDLV